VPGAAIVGAHKQLKGRPMAQEKRWQRLNWEDPLNIQ